jgi:type I restriction-modification system DNA methylase subunit
MLEQDITEVRKERHQITQEDFTPEEVVDIMYQDCPEEMFSDFSKTILDPCSGIGNLLLYAIKRRLEYCKTNEDVYAAISTIYGTELMEDNVDECKKNILFTLLSITSKKGINLDESKVIEILNNNFQATDTFKWDYKHWKHDHTGESLELF